MALHLFEYAVYRGRVRQVDAVLGDMVLRQRRLVRGGCHCLMLAFLCAGGLSYCFRLTCCGGLSFMRQLAEEEGDSDHGVAAVVGGRVDDASVALAADQRAHLVHLGRDIDLPHCGREVLATMGLGHIAKSPAGAEVGDRIARCNSLLLSPFEQIIRHCHKGILLDERFAVFAYES